MTARLIIGDVFEQLAKLPDESVDLIVTSPPFLALRSYLPADHPDKAKEIGSEPTPAAFLDTLLDLTVEWRRVLAPHGSIAVELGDTYAGSGGAGGDYNTTDGWRDGQDKFVGAGLRNRGKKRDELGIEPPERNARGNGWPLDKSLCGIPTLYAWSLAYGRNLLNPDHTIEPWRVRNLLCWARPNPPVGALGDKWRPATSYVTVACVGRARFFDLDAVREAVKHPNQKATGRAGTRDTKGNADGVSGQGLGDYDASMSAGAPPLDWLDERETDWQPLIGLPTQPYPGSHFATFPSQLPKRLIECMCPQRVCRVCGKPSERIAVTTNSVGHGVYQSPGRDQGSYDASRDINKVAPDRAERETLGWSDCGHDDWRNGLVFDPFSGSGTTLAVAVGCGRDAIGFDLDARNADLARERVGLFLEVEQ